MQTENRIGGGYGYVYIQIAAFTVYERETMKNISYDPDADAAYIRIKDSKIVDSETVASGVICDYDENDQVVGIEILSIKNCKKRTPSTPKVSGEMNFAFLK